MKLAGVGDVFGPVPLNRKNTRRYTGNGMWCFSTCQQAGPRRQLMGQLCAVLTEFGLGKRLIIIIASIRSGAWLCGVASRPSYGAFKTCIRSGLPKKEKRVSRQFSEFLKKISELLKKISESLKKISESLKKISEFLKNQSKSCKHMYFLQKHDFSVPEAPFLNYWKIFLNSWKINRNHAKTSIFM